MTRSIFAALAALSFVPGCIVVDDGPDPAPAPNYAPTISWAEAGCYWDGYYGDFIWYFEADADDPNGVLDVTSMWADVYDEASGAWVDSFELYPTDDPYIWFSDWLGSSTYLSCGYTGYVVDFWAYDSMQAEAVYSTWPLIY